MDWNLGQDPNLIQLRCKGGLKCPEYRGPPFQGARFEGAQNRGTDLWVTVFGAFTYLGGSTVDCMMSVFCCFLVLPYTLGQSQWLLGF